MSTMLSRTAARAVLVFLVGVGAVRMARAQSPAPIKVRYAFQPDCLRKAPDAACETPRGDHQLDFGPQIAVWVEKGDGSGYVESLLVTNAVAVFGIGNRPGYWMFPSNWHFPYGKRTMVLPIWAHARGRIYDSLLMQDDDGNNHRDRGLGFHEQVSSPDPYYCLTFKSASWVMDSATVDAITCPTGMFNSSKGKFVPSEPKSYYPPRNDLTKVTSSDCDVPSGNPCPHTSANEFGQLNDLDAVAAATPPYGRVFTGVWNVPVDLPDGKYALVVEVNKEFDNNAAHTHTSYQDPALPDNGLRDNIGQPSVVYRVPFDLDRTKKTQVSLMDFTGYGDWDGMTGTVHPPDSAISTTPGSGAARLMVIPEPAALGSAGTLGRVHVATDVPETTTVDPCKDAGPGDGLVKDLNIPAASVTSTEAKVSFSESVDHGHVVEQYEIRYREGDTMTDEVFAQATPAPAVIPTQPGAPASITLSGLKAKTTYVVGVRVRGGCVNQGPLATRSFTTLGFTQLTGCFVATAAYGSPLAPQVGALRKVRDRLKASSSFVAAAVGLYERSSPPVAAALRESDTTRALVRSALGPFLQLLP
jgi:hypothetical protein